jgi:hypothetical protein
MFLTRNRGQVKGTPQGGDAFWYLCFVPVLWAYCKTQQSAYEFLTFLIPAYAQLPTTKDKSTIHCPQLECKNENQNLLDADI